MSIFAKVPIEAINDKRLSPTEFKVLITLMSFVRTSNEVWPKRETISKRCGIAVQNISRATAALVEYGWLQKTGNGGKKRPSRYLICTPFTCADSGRVCADTRPDSDTITRPDSDTITRPDSGRRIEERSEKRMEEPSAKRLQALLEKLDRISTRFESQQNPVLESIAEELGIATPSGSTAQCNQRLQREIRHRLDAEHMEESTA